ncbi:hypothetical protein EPUL_004903 [Erysiphe pulchra]|uniref:Uncharacterized protein n=1 Tax=Erysiphe pulchra TaxID=225359 RepID=A0A2S4PP37_9PEZI|nr:hypothetical protein EPUL_004903 [Erysiphe pulchra]
MRQGESQAFRKFILQEWELQLEYSGGQKWPDSIKINNLGNALSNNKIRDKYTVLDLPISNYHGWVKIITRVAAIMEDTLKGLSKEVMQTAQYASRSGSLQSEYLPGLAVKETPNSLPSGSTDLDGDTVMSGMKIDVDNLTSLIARINGERYHAKSTAN